MYEVRQYLFLHWVPVNGQMVEDTRPSPMNRADHSGFCPPRRYTSAPTHTDTPMRRDFPIPGPFSPSSLAPMNLCVPQSDMLNLGCRLSFIPCNTKCRSNPSSHGEVTLDGWMGRMPSWLRIVSVHTFSLHNKIHEIHQRYSLKDERLNCFLELRCFLLLIL